MNDHTLIEIVDLKKKYKSAKHPSLDGLSFSIQKGEKFGIFGPNGAGKTTLISIMCGILQPDWGELHYHFHQNKHQPIPLSKIGFVPQDLAFFQELTPVQNLRYFGGLYGISNIKLKERIAFLLDRVGLSHVQHKKINTFSGGMKRRINLAIGLINMPDILFLDEPTVGVDIQSKSAIFSLLEELNQNGTTIVYTSHHLKEAESFCQRIMLLDKGKVIALNEISALLTEYRVENLEDLLLQLTGKTLRD